MAAFVSRPWGRYVYVRSHVRRQNGKKKLIPSYYRIWPGTKAELYFRY